MNRQERIEDLLRRYMSVVSHTGTDLERNPIGFFEKYFNEVQYFKNRPENCGFYPVKNDFLNREIAWALLRGEGSRTIVLIHHLDTVDTDDFGQYKDQAYNPEMAKEVLSSGLLPVSEEVKKDIESGEWYFGRGASDMKGGASIHLSLLEEYTKEKDFQGNILMLAVPDEENSSAGMRSASYLMKELKDQHDLEYVLMLDVEPHERVEDNKITIYDGSIGKVMPIFLARGKLAHTGQIYSGLNPIHLLSAMVRETEIDPSYVETRGNTTSPGPTWLYLKDRKYVYDVSLPLTAGGYMSVLPLSKSPMEIMEMLKETAIKSFEQVIEDMKKRYEPYRKVSSIDYGPMDFQAKVYTFDELMSRVKAENQDKKSEMQKKEEEIIQSIQKGEFDRVEGSFQWMEYVLSLLKDKDPCIVIGMAAPYYPAVNNRDLEVYDQAQRLIMDLEKECKEKYDLGIEVQNYFTGICDLSYGMFTESDETISYIEDNMLLWGTDYEIPLHLIKEMSMPVLNLGPWGKDLHKYTERVLVEDLTQRIPHLIDFIIRQYL